MSSPKIVSCLTVSASKATFAVTPVGSYTLCAWNQQSGEPQQTVIGKRAISLGTGKWRVAVYDGEPDPIDEAEFFITEPFSDTGYGCELGAGATFMEPPSTDPWPA